MSSPDSNTPYIIICNGRIAVMAAKDVIQQIVAASQCATDLCSFMGLAYSLNPLDLHPISQIQHYLMDHADTLSKKDAQGKIDELFTFLDALEDKY